MLFLSCVSSFESGTFFFSFFFAHSFFWGASFAALDCAGPEGTSGPFIGPNLPENELGRAT